MGLKPWGLEDYCIFRKDRVGQVGGGILIATKMNIRATRRFDLEKLDVEFCGDRIE
jgi:hypothetical protein